jgi:hypothetical protein
VFYALKRKRSTLLDLSDEELEKAVPVLLVKRRRWTLSFGKRR